MEGLKNYLTYKVKYSTDNKRAWLGQLHHIKKYLSCKVNFYLDKKRLGKDSPTSSKVWIGSLEIMLDNFKLMKQ